jgi:hypothetical protein
MILFIKGSITVVSKSKKRTVTTESKKWTFSTSVELTGNIYTDNLYITKYNVIVKKDISVLTHIL